ncbi:hypothetical protein LCGC14_0569800 [marine sediment metagenome]|uniref:DNA N-6-adenine-methyltransferase (Dam) n=1 Tax=marine sediment metagenome TaxID=412755 RepID=A0A0F9USQ3_9ZZZZ
MNKSTNGKGNIPSRDEWQTSTGLFEVLNKEYNFTLDCCANSENKKTWQYSNNFISVIDTKNSMCWMNPPFSKAYEMFEHFFRVVHKGVAIYRCDNLETKIWQKLILLKASWIFIPLGRVHYEGMEGKGSRFPSALIGFNVDPPKELEGTLLIPNCETR